MNAIDFCFSENWTNVIAFKGESGKVLIQQHDWIKSCRAVILKPGEKVRVEQYRSSCQDLFDMAIRVISLFITVHTPPLAVTSKRVLPVTVFV
jgi:hypothetical protein